jgi:putative membrane protein
MPDMPWRSMKAYSRIALRRIELTVEGMEHIPASGPAIIAARHVHHYYDGLVLLHAIQRPIHFVVALDWVSSAAGKQAMARACHAAGWPVVDRQHRSIGTLRAAVHESVSILQRGNILVLFPEEYPNIDPNPTPKRDIDAFLPFKPGAAHIARLASTPQAPVSIVPAGLHYLKADPWKIMLRFGAPHYAGTRRGEAGVTADIEDAVRLLSAAP